MRKVLVVVLVLLVAVIAWIASRPASYHIERSTTVPAAPQAVYARIADFHQWAGWSPWEKLDPGMKRTFSGAGSGTGAVYEWTGNDKVGQGRMTVVDARPSSTVDIKLEFIKPFRSSCSTRFTLAPDGAGTHVTWTMDGTNDFVGKAFTLFMDMDKTVGGDFERGLASLRAVAGAAPEATGRDSTAAPAATKAN